MNQRFGILLSLAILLMTGCGQRAEALALEPGDVSSAVKPSAEVRVDGGKIKGDIERVSYGKGSAVLIEADELSLYDIAANRVLEKAPKEDFISARYQPRGDGYGAVGDIRHSMAGKVVFYNNALQKEKELTFSEITGTNDPLFSDVVALSPDGKSIAYYGKGPNGAGIYIYQVGTKTRTRILNLDYGTPSAARAGILHIDQLRFTGDGMNLILFTGVENGNSQSIGACGKIGVDGSGLVNEAISGFTPIGIAGCYDSFAFFEEDDRARSGRILKLDAATGAKKFLSLATKQERAVYGSDAGKHFATAALDDSGCTIRIYETATDRLLSEQLIPHGGNALYVAQIPEVRVLDDAKTCIVLMGNRQDDLKTKVTVFRF